MDLIKKNEFLISNKIIIVKAAIIVTAGEYFTVFAPTDEAFQKIPQAQLKNKTWLEDIVKFHIVQVNCPVIYLIHSVKPVQKSHLKFCDFCEIWTHNF